MSKNPHLEVGSAAPDITVNDIHDSPVQLASYWSNGPMLVTFLRHFG